MITFDIVTESLYIAMEALFGISIGLDICFVGFMILVWFDEKKIRLPKIGEWKTFCYITLILGGIVFLFGFFLNLSILNREQHDQQISQICVPAILGDSYIINDTEIIIGTAYRLDDRPTRWGRVNYTYEETTIFIQGTPVENFQGYRIIKDNQLKEYLCSPQAIETIY
ncbi:hypothetical protein KBC75_01460 [Candidatus Shapirobacteria bacterium]|nr:hypothetical protein [Candidatus Shapirobacteria bacterium]